jgi:hypothetical protein
VRFVIAIALAFISLFSVGTFLGWASLFMLGLIPMQVVAVVLWGGNPSFVSGMSQPMKGWRWCCSRLSSRSSRPQAVFVVVGEGVSPPVPIPSHFASSSCRRRSGWPS